MIEHDAGRSTVTPFERIIKHGELPALLDWPQPLDLEALSEREPPPPKFIIPDWLPVGYAALLAGHGGAGKSALALHLAACLALGKPFCGAPVDRLHNVTYLACEDRADVLEWRLSRIARHLGVSVAGLRGTLTVFDLVGHDTLLWARDPRTGFTFTPAFGRLQERIYEHATEVLIVDGVADTFGGNENARNEVKAYVNALLALIPADLGAVILVAHVNRPTANEPRTAQGYSGSTAWHNSVRARWYLYPESERGEEGDKARTGDLILELQKSNLGRIDRSMRFTWDEQAHLFIGREIIPATGLDRAHRDRIEHRDVLRAFQGCATRAIDVPAASAGPRTAYHVLASAPEFPDTLKRAGKPERARFWRILENLRQSGALVPASYTDDTRHKRASLVLSTEAMRQCVE